MTHQEMEKQR